MAIWQLYVDETGSFGRPEQHAALAGVLLEAYPSRERQKDLRAALEGVWEGVPWPAHASRLNTVSLRLVHHLAGLDGGSTSLRDACEPAVAAVRAAHARARSGGSSPEAVITLLEEVERIRSAGGHAPEPSYDVTRHADAWLATNHFPAWQRIRSLQVRQEAAMRRLLARLTAGSGGARMFAVLAMSPRDPTGPSGHARYLATFETLAERVQHLLRRSDGEVEQVMVRAASYRGVHQHQLVRSWSKAARVSPAPGAAACSALVLPPLSYHRADTPPGLVLADFVANRARHAWKRSWGDVVTVMERIGVVVERAPNAVPSAGALPAWSCEGPLQDALREGLSGTPIEVATLPDHGRAWTAEQATAWLRALVREVA